MATITGLAAASALDGTEVTVVVQGGVDKRASTAAVAAGGAPRTHAASHAAGGGDPVTIAPSQISAAIPVAGGGTGAATRTAGYNALSPATTRGDLEVHNGTDVVRVPVGTDGQVLSAASGQAAGVQWVTAAGGVVPAGRLVATTGSLTGGGDLTADRTLSLVNDMASPGANQVYSTNGSGVRGWHPQAVATSTGGLTVDPTIRTTAFTAAAGTLYRVNTSGGAFAATLPSLPVDGTLVEFDDVTGGFGANPLSVLRNGATISGAAADASLTVAGGAYRFLYSTAQSDWDVVPWTAGGTPAGTLAAASNLADVADPDQAWSNLGGAALGRLDYVDTGAIGPALRGLIAMGLSGDPDLDALERDDPEAARALRPALRAMAAEETRRTRPGLWARPDPEAAAALAALGAGAPLVRALLRRTAATRR